MRVMRKKPTWEAELVSLEKLCADCERGYTQDIPAPLSDPLEILMREEAINQYYETKGNKQ